MPEIVMPGLEELTEQSQQILYAAEAAPSAPSEQPPPAEAPPPAEQPPGAGHEAVAPPSELTAEHDGPLGP